MQKKYLHILVLVSMVIIMLSGCVSPDEIFSAMDEVEGIMPAVEYLPEEESSVEVEQLETAAEPIDFAGYEELDEYLDAQFVKLDVAGMSVVIVEDEMMTYFGCYGKMNIEKDLDVTPETIFLMASITKTVTGVAVMQLVEDGLLELDQDVNSYLPYDVRNPAYPKQAITVRMLLAHTSSIIDNWDALDQTYTFDNGGGDPDISLRQFSQYYFLPSGKWYDENDNFMDEKPGTYYEYTNSGYALLGTIVEEQTGMQFYEYCNENIFEPLGMENSSLFLKDLDLEKIAIPYSNGEAMSHYSFATYLDGSLRTSSMDFAKFVSMAINMGAYLGVEILHEETFALMLEEQYPGVIQNQGLTWDLNIAAIYDIASNSKLVGHNGGEFGVDTLMFFNPDNEVGVFILINDEITRKNQNDYDEIIEYLIGLVE